MSSITDYCILCSAVVTKKDLLLNSSLRLKPENVTKRHVNFQLKFKGNVIDLVILCDILRVSVNAAENYFGQTVSLCSACEADMNEINQILLERKRLKYNLLKMMRVVRTKLQESLSDNPQRDRQTQFNEIRKEIISDLSNILRIQEPKDVISADIKNEPRDDDSENNNWDDINEPVNNTATTVNAVSKIAQVEVSSYQISQVDYQESDSFLLPSMNINQSPILPSQSLEIPRSEENQDFDIDIDTKDEKESNRGNSDPDFSDISLDQNEDCDDEDYEVELKRKSPNKSSPLKSKRRKKPAGLVKKSDGVMPLIDGQDAKSGKQQATGAKISTEEPKKKRSRKDNSHARDKSQPITLAGAEKESESVPDLFVCPYCKKFFKDDKTLRQHLKVFHGGVNKNEKHTVTCEICGKVMCHNNIYRHRKEVHGEKKEINLKCPQCDNVYKTERGLKDHLQTHSEDFSPHICAECGKCFQTTATLSSHEWQHKKGKQIECSVCHKMWYNKTELRIHMLSHSTERKYVCERCGKSYKASSQLRAHERYHRIIDEKGELILECNQCDKVCKSKSALYDHKQAFHALNKKIHQCNICGKIMSRADHLKTHQKIHQRD